MGRDGGLVVGGDTVVGNGRKENSIKNDLDQSKLKETLALVDKAANSVYTLSRTDVEGDEMGKLKSAVDRINAAQTILERMVR